MIKLFLVGIYYLVRPRPLPYSPLPHLLIILLLLSVLMGEWWNTPHANEQTLLAYSPPLSSPNDSMELAKLFWELGDYEQAMGYYEASRQIPANSPTAFEMERQFNPNRMLYEQLKEIDIQLLMHPTSRDLWLYKGWLGYLLGNEDLTDEASIMLRLLDPNHPQVQEFLKTVR